MSWHARLEEKEFRSCDAGRKENVRHGKGLFYLMLHLSDRRGYAYGFQEQREAKLDPITDIFRTMHVTAFGQHRLEATAVAKNVR